MKEVLKLIVEKGMSGRWYLTVITGIAFAYSVWKGKLPSEAAASIITMVFALYFTRADRNGGGVK